MGNALSLSFQDSVGQGGRAEGPEPSQSPGEAPTGSVADAQKQCPLGLTVLFLSCCSSSSSCSAAAPSRTSTHCLPLTLLLLLWVLVGKSHALQSHRWSLPASELPSPSLRLTGRRGPQPFMPSLPSYFWLCCLAP